MHGGNLLEANKLYGKQNYIDLSANINPFGPPAGIWEVLKETLKEIIHYPDPQYRRLKQKMAQEFALSEEEILLGNGAGELIYLILHGLRPQKVLIPQPAFSEYERAARACGAEVCTLSLGVEGWQNFASRNLTSGKSDWEKRIKECQLIFLNSPHNPTGSSLKREDFEDILSCAQKAGTWVVLDESFVDFLAEEKRWSGREYLGKYPNLIVLYSLTKFYAIPGLRLGAVFADYQILKRFKEHQDPWAVNVLAEEAGLAALNDQEYGARVRALLKESKTYFYNEFAEGMFSELRLYPSDVNFALLQILGEQSNQGKRKREMITKLGWQGILVRDCGNFQGLEGEYIRVAIKDKESMQALIKGLKGI